MLLNPHHPSLERAITIHPKTRRDAITNPTRILKPVSDNGKLGKGSNTITKGAWKGFPLYSLTLEERATCPDTCTRWRDCFGNNMGHAHRMIHDDALMVRLAMELSILQSDHPAGFVVRLHILGDFWSVAYVEFWILALAQFSALRIFGYTHRHPTLSPIGRAIARGLQNSRAWIRWSDRDGPMTATVNGPGIQCPEQTGKTQSCLTCALCWSTERAIAFMPH